MKEKNNNIKKDNTCNLEYAIEANLRQLRTVIGLLNGSIQKQFIVSNINFRNALNSAEYDFRKQKRFINKTIKSIIATDSLSVRLAKKKLFGNYVKEYISKYNEVVEILTTIYEVPNQYWGKINTLYHLIPEKTKKFWYKRLGIRSGT